MNGYFRKGVLVIGVILTLCCLIFLQFNSKLSNRGSSPHSELSNSQPLEQRTKQNDSEVTQQLQQSIPTSTPQPKQTQQPTTEAPKLVTQQPVVNPPPTGTYQVPCLSKDLVVHSAYFDPRPRNGHSNVTVLFINVNRKILDPGWILGCGANDIRAAKFTVYSILENALMHACCGPNTVVYENQLILCYDLPAQNGSSVFAIYKTSASSMDEMVTYSRQPLFHPAPRVPPSGGDEFTVVVCSKLHDKHAPWIREFIQYQKTLGVDHIDFSVLDTFIKDDGYDQIVLKDPVVLNALREGFINFRVWPETYVKPGEAYYHSESLRKLGCIYRYLGTYDYVMPLDTDDFFNPVTSKKKLKEYIKEYCYKKPVGSCRFDWIRYYPDCGMNGSIGPNGNVTAHLKIMTETPERNFKSVHSTKAILDASFHDARCRACLAPGYRMISIPRSVAYISHMRFGLDDYWHKKICH